MSEPERLCITCAHSREADTMEDGPGGLYMHGDLAFCARARAEGEKPVVAPKQRFAPSDADANVCGMDAIFWEPRA